MLAVKQGIMDASAILIVEGDNNGQVAGAGAGAGAAGVAADKESPN